MKTASIRGWGVTLLAVMALAGCSGDPRQPEDLAALAEEALRVRTDAARGRLWVLGFEDLRVYDAATNRLLRRITLPEWSVARYECPPDLALDASGSAIISSNVVPRLWRVDGRSFEVSGQAIALEGREGWDIGFGPIAHTGNGVIYALTSNGISLWKIDTAGARAALVETYLPPAKTCAISRASLSRVQRNRTAAAS